MVAIVFDAGLVASWPQVWFGPWPNTRAYLLAPEVLKAVRKVMVKLTVARTLTSLMLLSTPVLACGTQLDPLPCEPVGLRQTDGQFTSAPRFRPVPSRRARTRSNRKLLAR